MENFKKLHIFNIFIISTTSRQVELAQNPQKPR